MFSTYTYFLSRRKLQHLRVLGYPEPPEVHVLRRLVSGWQRGHGAVADDLVDEGVDAVRLPAVGEADGAAADVGQEGHL